MSLHLEPLSISRETVRQLALGIDQHELIRARFGRQIADAKKKPRGPGVKTSRPLQRVEMDHFKCDVHLISALTGAPLGRPWLTVAVDHYSGAVLGYYMSFTDPSAASVLACLRHVILPKHGKTESDIAWPMFGIPECLVVDNGKDLTSRGVRETCLNLGIVMLFTPTRSPWYKGVIERFGRTMNTRLVHWLQGTTLGKPATNLNYSAQDEAVITDAAFTALLEQYFIEIHNRKPQRGQSKTPLQLFLSGIQEWPPRLPASEEEVDSNLTLRYTRKLTQAGILFSKLQYQTEALGRLWNRLGTNAKEVTIRVNPSNLQHILVEHPLDGSLMRVDCVDKLSWPRTLTYHLAMLAHARENHCDVDNAQQLAKAELRLMQRSHEAAAAGKKMLRKHQAEFERQAAAAGPAKKQEIPPTRTPEPDTPFRDKFDEVFGSDE